MSNSAAVMPSASISRHAFPLVVVLVPKPGMVKPRMLVLGSSSRSMARAATISAWVESRPPETPITTLSVEMARSRWARPSTWMLYAS